MASAVTFRVALIDPDGTEHEITDRVAMGSLRTEERAEEDLAELTHSNCDFTLWDRDGWLREQWAALAPGSSWRVIVDEDDGAGWVRVFQGVLDPLSVAFDMKDETFSLGVFGLTKLLENVSAETVQRSVTGRTATVSAASATVTVSDTTDLAVGDQIKLEGGGASESQTILTVDSATQVTTTAVFAAAFTGAALTLETPFYRDRSVTSLATELCALAGITDVTVDEPEAIQSTPFPSSINTSGLASVSSPDGMLETGGEVKVYAGGNRYGATDLVTGFANQGADTAKMDWRPYDATSTAPGTLRAGTDDGTKATDPATGDYYTLTLGATALTLNKNGSPLVATVRSKTANDIWSIVSVEWCPQQSEVWVGYVLDVYDVSDEYASTDIGINRYNAAGVPQGSLPGAQSRSVRALGYMAVREMTAYGVTGNEPDNRDSGLSLYNVSGAEPVFVKTLPVANNPALWTLRAVGSSHLCCVAQPASGATVVAVWDHMAGTLAAQHVASATQTTTNRATVYDETGTQTPAYVFFAGGAWGAVSTEFAGVIPYADFSGMSVAGALRALALVTATYLYIDHYGSAYLTNRQSALTIGRDAIEIERVLDAREVYLWEGHRASVGATGKDESDEDYEVIVGDTGAGASRLELDIPLPMNPATASALASGYLEFVSTQRRAYELTVDRPPQWPGFLDRILWDGVEYLVLAAESDHVARQARLTVVEGGV